jgi:hypothetical protein
MLRWRPGTAEKHPDAVQSDTTRRPETVAGNQPCSALRCSSLVGMPCSYVDRRGRRCKTAWCPADRSVVEGKVYCALHAHAMQALEWEFGAASHPDIDSRTVPVLQWISSAAADEVIATLNVFCALNGEMLVAEPVRRRFNPLSHSRVWEKQWKTLSPTSVTIRVSISSDEDRPTEIHIKVNGHDVNVVPPPFNRELSAPTEADMRWLDQEVLSPISAAVARWMMQAAERRDLGYIPVGGGIDDADARLMARPASQGAAIKSAPSNSVDEAALDVVRRAHFLYGLEEIQAVAEHSAETG